MNDAEPGLHALILKAAGGEALAQAELYELTRQPLHRYIVSHFSSQIIEEDVQEIIHYSILQIFLHAKSYRGRNDDSSAWQWAYTIARNQALKWLRVTRRTVYLPDPQGKDSDEGQDEILHSLILRFNPASMEESVEDQALERIVLENLLSCLQHFNQRERLVISWRYQYQLTLEEIAERLHVRRPRVHQIITRIHQKWRKAAKLDEI